MPGKTRSFRWQPALVAGLLLVACHAFTAAQEAGKSKKPASKERTESDRFDSVVVRSRSGYRVVNGRFKRGEEIYKGRLLEVTPEKVYFESWRGKKSVSRKSILQIDRQVDRSRVETFEKYRKAAKNQSQWSKLLAYCEKHGLAPEARACKRALLKFSPDNEAYHLAIGEKKHAGKWVDEFRVESMLQSGYELKGDELVKSDGDASKKKRKTRHSRKIKALDHVKEAVEKAPAPGVDYPRRCHLLPISAKVDEAVSDNAAVQTLAAATVAPH